MKEIIIQNESVRCVDCYLSERTPDYFVCRYLTQVKHLASPYLPSSGRLDSCRVKAIIVSVEEEDRNSK
jgi:hypothetical protein